MSFTDPHELDALGRPIPEKEEADEAKRIAAEHERMLPRPDELLQIANEKRSQEPTGDFFSPTRKYPLWNQPFIPTSGTFSPDQWGKPDYILQGAQRYPGMAPAPWMPQASDARQLIQRTTMFFGQNGSQNVQNLALRLGLSSDKYWKDFMAGRAATAKQHLLDMQVHMTEMDNRLQDEFRELSESHAAYRDDPEKLRQDWLNIARRHGNNRLVDVLQTQGTAAAERMVNEMHLNNTDQLKLLTQRAQLEKIGQETQRAEEAEAAIKQLTAPEQDNEHTREHGEPRARTDAAGNPPLRDSGPHYEDIRPVDGLTPDQLHQPAQQQAQQGQPQQQVSGPADQTGAPQPASPATPGQPAPQSGAVPSRPSAVESSPGVAAAGAPPPSPTAPATQGTSPSAGTAPSGSTAQTQDGLSLPAPKAMGGYDRDTLDRLAWRFLEDGKPPHTGAIPKDFQNTEHIQNLVVQARAQQLDAWLTRIVKNVPQERFEGGDVGTKKGIARADGVLNRIAQEDYFLAARLRGIIHGDLPLPSSGFAGTSAFARKVTDVAMALDPNFGAWRYRENQRTRDAFSSATQWGGQLSGFSLALQHGAALLDSINNLPNTNFTSINEMANWIGKQMGASYETRFRSQFTHYTQELTRAFRGSAGALGDINREYDIVNQNASPAQLKMYLRATAELLDGRINELAGIWNRGTNENITPEQLMTNPRAKQALHYIKQIPLPEGRDNSPSFGEYDRTTVDPQDRQMIAYAQAHPERQDLINVLWRRGLWDGK